MVKKAINYNYSKNNVYIFITVLLIPSHVKKNKKQDRRLNGTGVASARRNDRFFDFNIIDQLKLNFKKSKKIDILRADLTDYRKID